MLSKYTLFFVVGLCVNYNGVLGYETQYCYSQACRECPWQKEQGPGEQVKCDLTGLVTMDWLNNQRPQIPLNIGSNLVDFACIKMVATDPKATYDSTDVLRGCVIAQSAQAICDGLVGTEIARGKTDAKCHFCTKDYCNGSRAIASSLILLFISFLISKVISN